MKTFKQFVSENYTFVVERSENMTVLIQVLYEYHEELKKEFSKLEKKITNSSKKDDTKIQSYLTGTGMQKHFDDWVTTKVKTKKIDSLLPSDMSINKDKNKGNGDKKEDGDDNNITPQEAFYKLGDKDKQKLQDINHKDNRKKHIVSLMQDEPALAKFVSEFDPEKMLTPAQEKLVSQLDKRMSDENWFEAFFGNADKVNVKNYNSSLAKKIKDAMLLKKESVLIEDNFSITSDEADGKLLKDIAAANKGYLKAFKIYVKRVGEVAFAFRARTSSAMKVATALDDKKSVDPETGFSTNDQKVISDIFGDLLAAKNNLKNIINSTKTTRMKVGSTIAKEIMTFNDDNNLIEKMENLDFEKTDEFGKFMKELETLSDLIDKHLSSDKRKEEKPKENK
jgi:hypothetical protein